MQLYHLLSLYCVLPAAGGNFLCFCALFCRFLLIFCFQKHVLNTFWHQFSLGMPSQIAFQTLYIPNPIYSNYFFEWVQNHYNVIFFVTDLPNWTWVFVKNQAFLVWLEQIALKKYLEGFFRQDFFLTASTHRDTSIPHVFEFWQRSQGLWQKKSPLYPLKKKLLYEWNREAEGMKSSKRKISVEKKMIFCRIFFCQKINGRFSEKQFSKKYVEFFILNISKKAKIKQIFYFDRYQLSLYRFLLKNHYLTI